MIVAKDNDRVKKVAALCSSASKRRESGRFILEGLRLCEELAKENFKVYETYYTAAAFEKNEEVLLKLKSISNEFFEVSPAVFSKMADTKNPQGILCVAEMPHFEKKLDGSKYIAFENIQDPSNLGAAARTADALGFSGIIVSNNGTDPFSPKVLRASMGAILRLPIIVCEDFCDTLSSLKNGGYEVTGTVVNKDSEKINRIPFDGKQVAVIGNEANGLTDDAKKRCSRLVTIPMSGRVESLNAAAAAAIVMWEMSR